MKFSITVSVIYLVLSPSPRRAWIEILFIADAMRAFSFVALPTEGVD